MRDHEMLCPGDQTPCGISRIYCPGGLARISLQPQGGDVVTMSTGHLAMGLQDELGDVTNIQLIGLWENLQEHPMIFMGKSMVSYKFSHQPIH